MTFLTWVRLAVVFAALLGVAKADAEADWPGSDVAHLTGENFDGFLSENPSTLIMFYAPWCGHCKHFKPAYMEAATALKESSDSGKLAAVDCTAHEAICSRFEVRGYPTVKYFKNGKENMKYPGARTKDALLSFLKDPKEPPPPAPAPATPFSDQPNDVVLLTDKDFEGFISSKPTVLAFFYAPWCGHCKNAKPALVEAAAALKERNNDIGYIAAVDCTATQAACPKYGVRGFPTIILFKDGKEAGKHSGPRTKDGFLEFMQKGAAAAPPTPTPAEPAKQAAAPSAADFHASAHDVKLLTDADFADFTKTRNTLVFFYAPWCGHCKNAKPAVAEVSNELKNNGNKAGYIAAVDCTVHKQVCGKYGIRAYPTIKYFKNGELVADYQNERSKTAMLEFLTKNAELSGAPAAANVLPEGVKQHHHDDL